MTEWSRATTDDGQTFVFREEGSGPLVLLYHGFPDTPHGWERIGAGLAEARYRAVAPWLRGYHPETIVEGRAYDPVTIGSDPIRLLDALGEERAAVVGHDWGAIIAFSAAAQYPDRLQAIVPIALPHPAYLPRDPKTLWAGRHFFVNNLPWAEWWAARNDFAYFDRLYQRWAPTWTNADRERCLKHAKEALADPRTLNAALSYYRDARKSEDPGPPSPSPVPGLIVADLKDVEMDRFQRSAALLGEGSEAIALEAGGHWPHREREGEFIARLVDFLRTAS
jgi:pimeloyl-ACP methyl ester carboxylesterase